MIRQSARTARQSARPRGATVRAPGESKPVKIEPINPITGMYPYRAKCHGGYNFLGGQSPYSFWNGMLGYQPWVGTVYQMEIHTGGVRRRSIDIERHFNTQDRYKVIPWNDIVKLYFLRQVWLTRAGRWWPLTLITFNFWYYNRELRREPQESFIDREEYFENFDFWYQGGKIDHHAIESLYRSRRANKWGYNDPTIADHHSHPGM